MGEGENSKIYECGYAPILEPTHHPLAVVSNSPISPRRKSGGGPPSFAPTREVKAKRNLTRGSLVHYLMGESSNNSPTCPSRKHTPSRLRGKRFVRGGGAPLPPEPLAEGARACLRQFEVRRNIWGERSVRERGIMGGRGRRPPRCPYVLHCYVVCRRGVTHRRKGERTSPLVFSARRGSPFNESLA